MVFITQTIFYKDGPPKTEMQFQYCTVLYEKQFTKPRIRDTIIMDKLSNDRNTEKSPQLHSQKLNFKEQQVSNLQNTQKWCRQKILTKLMPIIMTLNRDSIYYDSIPRTRFQESLYYCTTQNITTTQQLHKTSAFFPSPPIILLTTQQGKML